MPNCLNQVFLICPSLWSCLAGPYRRLRPRASLLMLLMASARWLPDVPQTSLRWKTKRNPPVRRRRLGIIVRISSPQMLNVDVDSCRKSDLLNNFHQFHTSSPLYFTTMHHVCQTKNKLKTFMDSMLQKAGKIRGLVRDLKQNYSQSSAMATSEPWCSSFF